MEAKDLLCAAEKKIKFCILFKKIMYEFVHTRVNTIVSGCGRAVSLRHSTPRSV